MRAIADEHGDGHRVRGAALDADLRFARASQTRPQSQSRHTGADAAGRAVVFCKVVAVAEAQVKRDGQVRAKGSPVHHATLDPLEERLGSQAGPGVIGAIAGRAPLGARFVKGGRERLLARAFMIRVIVLMTLTPDARPGDVIAALAGDLALVPWARPWRPASARAAGDWRNALGPAPLEELRDLVLGSAWREHQRPGCPGAVKIGTRRPLRAGALDGHGCGSLTHLRTGSSSALRIATSGPVSTTITGALGRRVRCAGFPPTVPRSRVPRA